MKKNIILKRKNFKFFITIIFVFFMVFILISSNISSLKIIRKSKDFKVNFEEKSVSISDGLAPPKKPIQKTYSNEKSINLIQSKIGQLDCYEMFGYKANPSPEELVWFYTCDPEYLEEIELSQSDDFIAGLTCGNDGYWYGCENGTGKLWIIDEYGEMTLIGGGGMNLNSIAYDPINNRIYASGCNNYLYEIVPDTGEQEKIGSFGSGANYMIGLSFDAEGILYGWDLGCDKLWVIDTEIGEATEVGPLGIDLNYAQDGDFYRESDQLYLTAYTTTGQLYECDKTTGECTLIGNFEDGAQITASMFDQCWCCHHDIGLKDINYPISGPAGPDMKMQITVENVGYNSETFYAQMEIIKNQEGAGTILLDEDFSDTFPPEGWETDYWLQCNDNCSSDPPCACAYRENHVENYDNYISSKPVNASGYEMCKLSFYFKADLHYPHHCNFYVKYRKNEDSPWVYITPWENPMNGNFEGRFYEIFISDYDQDCGDALEIRWEYIGYYYYFKSFVLDCVTIETCETYFEYTELIENITIKYGETIQVNFSEWMPSEWQDPDFENAWKNYYVHAFVKCRGDYNPRNDKKNKWVNLYFGYFDDIGCNNITGPESGPAQTFPVKSHVKNFGQFPESNFSINISIAETSISDTLINESSWSTVPPNGWTDQHNTINKSYGWRKSNTSYSGGKKPETYIPYYYCKADYVFYSYAIETSDYNMLKLTFKSYINDKSGQGFYSLEAGYSTDKETWHSVWHVEPVEDNIYDVVVPIFESSETLYIGFWVEGNPYYFHEWYIDDIRLFAIDSDEEFSDNLFYDNEIDPGEEIKIEFDNWIPEFLSEKITSQKSYFLRSWTNLDTTEDKDRENDLFEKFITLDFYHDVGIDKIESPTGHPLREGGQILHDNGGPDGRNGFVGSMYNGYSNILIDDFTATNNWTIQGGHIHFVWNSGYTSNTKTIRLYIFEETGICDPSLVLYDESEAIEFTEITTGNYYFSRPEIIVDFLLENPIHLSPGKWWIGIQPEGIIENIAYLLTAENKDCMIMADLPYFGYPRWSSSKYLWGDEYDISWQINGYADGLPYPDIWIQPGTEDIDVIVKNYGTFPENNLTCFAEIKEFITDPDNGTKVYEDNITNINLDEPLNGTELLLFDDFTFADEGVYGLYLDFPLEIDDYQRNNLERLIIAIDDTNPYSWVEDKDPPEPDGENGWYVSDVTITICAEDPDIQEGIPGSGVCGFYVSTNGETNFYPGDCITFVITEDGDNFVEYCAVDCAGNVESPKNTFTIDIDQTVPEISLTYDIVGGNKWQGWDFEFTATATDAMSGMDRVEFYLNNLIQETIEGSGPEFVWTIKYNPLPRAIFKTIAYDQAGLSDYDEIIDPTKNTHSYSKNYRIFNILNNYRVMYLSLLSDNFPVFRKILGGYDK